MRQHRVDAIWRRLYKAYNHLACQASPNLDVNACQLKANYKYFDHLGHHWFGDVDGVGVPFFSIPGRGFLSAQKVGDIPAPAGAYNGGSNGYGAVDWLKGGDAWHVQDSGYM